MSQFSCPVQYTVVEISQFSCVMKLCGGKSIQYKVVETSRFSCQIQFEVVEKLG